MSRRRGARDDHWMDGLAAGSPSFVVTVLGALGLVALWRKVFRRSDGWDDLADRQPPIGRYGEQDEGHRS